MRISAFFVFYGFPHFFDVGISIDCTGLIDVADVHDRLVGEQEKIVGDFLFVFGLECYRACGFSLFEGLFIAAQYLVGQFGCFVAAGLCLFLYPAYAAFDGFEVFELQFVVDDFFVPHGVDRAIDMRNIVVVETSQNVQYGIGLAYVGKKFIAEAFSLTGTLYQPGYIDDFDRRGDDALRVYQLGQFIEPVVGYGDNTHIGFDGAKGEVCRLRFGVGQTVEKRRFTHVGQADYTAL